MQHQVIHGDSLDGLRQMADNSIDAIVTDPPYGLSKQSTAEVTECLLAWAQGREWQPTQRGGFMGKAWDAWVPGPALWRECLRVLKPGGHLLAFAGTRTTDLMTVALRLAGFEIRELIMWVYGSGFPKSHNGPWGGSALKPALEPITVARKPLQGTLAANVLQWGTGGLNIDACRVGDEEITTHGGGGQCGTSLGWSGRDGRKAPTVRVDQNTTHIGRWPANLVHDGSAEAADGLGHAARYFYCSKASRRERDAGLEGMPESVKRGSMTDSKWSGDQRFDGQPLPVARNHHATVKPIALMEWLIKLVLPPGGVVLDPFAGSGTTGCAAARLGARSILIEREAEYVEIARRRVAYWSGELATDAMLDSSA